MKDIVKIEGLKEVQAALHELPKATAKNVVRRIMKERLKPVAEAAQRLVPIDQGDLRDSIVVSTKLTKRQRGKHKKDGPDDIEMFAGPNADPAAHLQEFGSRRHPAQPFMRPAWDGARQSLIENLAADFWREIEKAVARRARKMAKTGGE
jgi:HK97 gp10 family phage protein